MAVQRFRLPLQNARFPLVSTQAARAVCVPQLDGVGRTPQSFAGAPDTLDYNSAQIIYGENFMPASTGIKSVGYRTLVPATEATDFDSVFSLRDADENFVLFSPAGGQNYVLDTATNTWTGETVEEIWALTLASGYLPAASKITYAYVDGKTLVCYSRLKSTTDVDMSIMLWDSAAQTLTPSSTVIANMPFPAGEIDGISSSSGYLLVWSGLEVAWAPFNGAAFDFTSYANGTFTGAGSQIPEDVQGNITAIVGISGGFIIFTTRNAIASSYNSQAIQAPWVFREIPGAGGAATYEQLTVESSLGVVYAYTTAGMQLLTLNSSKLIFPDVSDFITNRQLERYDSTLHELIPGAASIDLFVKVTAVGNRYIVISYGIYPGTYSFALVWDLALERWGKLRITHRDCFYYMQSPTAEGLTYSMLSEIGYAATSPDSYSDMSATQDIPSAAPHALAFLLANGSVTIADWSITPRDAVDEAIVIIGRIQLSRSSNVQFNWVEVEGLREGELELAPSYDGRTLSRTEILTTIEQSGDYLRAGGIFDCKNFNIHVEGTFSLSTIIIEGTPSGRV